MPPVLGQPLLFGQRGYRAESAGCVEPEAAHDHVVALTRLDHRSVTLRLVAGGISTAWTISTLNLCIFYLVPSYLE